MSYPAGVQYPAPPYRLLGKWTGRRNDGESKICGQWKLGADFNVDNQAYLALKLSPYSAATITAVDATAAKAIPGVLMVITSDDVKNDAVLSKLAVGNYKLLPYDQVRYAGQEVAAVVAEDPYVAVEACEAINITYSKLPFVNKIQDAMASGAPQVWSGTPNLQTPTTYKFGDADTAMKDSSVTIFSETYESNDCHQNPVANMAGTVNAATSGRAEIWQDNQDCKAASRTLAGLVGLPYARGWAKGTTCAGSFGGKSGGGYQTLAIMMSQRLGRPVKYVMTREHDIRNGARHPRDVFNVSAAYKSDGTVTAIKVDCYNNCGASKSAGVGTASGAAAHFYNTYKYPNFTVNAYEVWTNYPSPGAYRNPPGPHASFAASVFMDKIANKLGMNPVDFAKKNNMYVAGDLNQLNNLPFYSIGQPDVMNLALSLSGFQSKWKKGPSSPTGTGVVHGIGFANTASGLGSTASSNSTAVILLSDGSLLVSSGGTDIGEGRTEQERLYAAEMMGLPMDYVSIANNDSEFIGDTGVTAGSMQTKNSGNCIVLACADAKNQMMAKAAAALNTTVDKLTYAMDGSMKIFLTSDPTQSRTFAQLSGQPNVIGVGKFTAPTGVTGNVFDSAVAEVDVDTDTGLVTVTNLTEVQDVGRIIFKMGLDGQMYAAMIQALGQTVQEEQWVDGPTGSLLGASHLDDKIPLFTQIPATIQCGYVEDAEVPPLSYNFGAKGMAEPPFDAPIPAIVNAVANAIGWWSTTLPITPDKVLKALGKA